MMVSPSDATPGADMIGVQALHAIPLAQVTPEASQQILFWLAVILGIVIAVLIAALAIRRLLAPPDEPVEQPGDTGFTLEDLRRLRAQGQLTEEEFEHARKGMIARSRAMLDAPVGELPVVGAAGEDLAARGTDGVDHTTDAAKRGQAEPEEHDERQI